MSGLEITEIDSRGSGVAVNSQHPARPGQISDNNRPFPLNPYPCVPSNSIIQFPISKPRGFLLGCLLLALVAPRTFAQIVWNPTVDFSTSNGNPNGVWTYGWMDTGFLAFTPYTNHGTTNWYGWGSDGSPAVWLNPGPGTSYGVPAGSLSIHPGNGNEPSVLRWTAPTGTLGLLQVSGEFLAGDSGTMQLAIFKNTKTTTLWSATDAGAFNLSVSIAPGDTLNFAVFGGYAYGNTPLQLTLAGVPEPATHALLALGLAALALAHRGRPPRRRPGRSE